MKTLSLSKIFFSCLVLLYVSACGKKENKALEDNEIKYDSIRITAVEHLFNDTARPGCNIDLKYVFPAEYKDKEILSSLQKQFNKIFLGEKYEDLSPGEAADKYRSDYLQEYKKVEIEYQDDMKRSRGEEEVPPLTWYSYYLLGDMTLHYNKGDIISCILYVDSYYGGAHGAHTYTFRTFDLTTGLPVKETDIFIEGYEKELNTLLVNDIAAQNEVTTAEELIELGYFGASELTSNDNFVADEKGLTYVYNEYEIAAYVLGAVKVFIPYSRLRMILKEENPLAKFYK